MSIRFYPAIIEGDAASGYGVFFPDLPGCTSAGDSLQTAALNAEQALAGHLELMVEGGETIPAPSRLDDMPAPLEPGVAEIARLLIRAELPQVAPA